MLDFRNPGSWPLWLIEFWLVITQPFGVTLDLADRHPWEAIDRYLINSRLKKHYFGSVYIAVGEAPE